MKIDIMTLFPEMVEAALGGSIIGRARARGLVELRVVNIRNFTVDKHKKTDDTPYGGGQGMVMLPEPLFRCHRALSGGQAVHTILLSPQGRTFDQQRARELLELGHIVLVCGHYEGVDQRFIDACVDEEISLGDFVLTGGEIPAMAVADAVCRLVPGVLAETASFTEESHWNGLLEFPQYTRPETWRGRAVPEVLLSGHHAKIARWRRGQSLARTRARRPDLFARLDLSDREDQKLLSELEEE